MQRAQRCDTCGLKLTIRVSGSACTCLMARMQCKECHELVYRSGTDSDGVYGHFGIYVHEPCGTTTEFECVDIRLLPVSFDYTLVDVFATEVEITDIHVKNAFRWCLPWTWPCFRGYDWYVVATCKTRRGDPPEKRSSKVQSYPYHCPDCKRETLHIRHLIEDYGWRLECRECGELHDPPLESTYPDGTQLL